MRRYAIPLVVVLALAMATSGQVSGGPATIRAVPIAPPGTCCAPSGALEVNLGAPGTYTISINFTINVQNNRDAYNIQAYFILNHTDASKLASAPTMVETSMGSPDAGTSGTALTRYGPFSDTPWTYMPGGVGPDCVFPTGCPALPISSYYNFTYIWTYLTGPSNGFNFWKVINVTFTAQDVSELDPAHFIIVGAGNSESPTNFDNPYATPWSGATNINVIPEFWLGTVLAVVVPLLALAGYMRLRGIKSLGLSP